MVILLQVKPFSSEPPPILNDQQPPPPPPLNNPGAAVGKNAPTTMAENLGNLGPAKSAGNLNFGGEGRTWSQEKRMFT